MISGTGSTLFEELGLYYIGPVDGHNMDDLVAVLNGGWCVCVGACGGKIRGRGLPGGGVDEFNGHVACLPPLATLPT
jgi:hypothetical protein